MIRNFLGAIALMVLAAATLLPATAHAGDQTATYFSMSSGLVQVGFKDKACGPYPTPFATIDGESNCAKVPNTWLYKLNRSDGTVVKEVRELTSTWDSTSTSTVEVDGRPVIVTDTLSVRDGRSVFGSFGVRNNWSLSDVTGIFGRAESAAERARFFATGLAATRTSEGGSAYLEKANNLLPSNGQQ